jgi:hypothetical protein
MNLTHEQGQKIATHVNRTVPGMKLRAYEAVAIAGPGLWSSGNGDVNAEIRRLARELTAS